MGDVICIGQLLKNFFFPKISAVQKEREHVEPEHCILYTIIDREVKADSGSRRGNGEYNHDLGLGCGRPSFCRRRWGIVRGGTSCPMRQNLMTWIALPKS
jgi:hypothetical protein